MADALAISLHDLGDETASGTSAAVDIGVQRTCLALELQVQVLSGSPASLACTIQTAPTTAGPWRDLGALPAVTAPATRNVVLLEAQRFVRVAWVLTGTTVKFCLIGFAHTLFATPQDVDTFAFPTRASDSVPANIKASACLAATEEAASYLKGRYTPPILTWGMDLRMHVAKMAGFGIMSWRGFQPGGSDDLIVKGRDDAIAYLKMVQKNDLQPPSITDADPGNVGTDDAYVVDVATSFWDTL